MLCNNFRQDCKTTHDALLDSAATNHFLQSNILPIFSEVKEATGPEVAVENGETITPGYQATIILSKNLSIKAQNTFIFEDLKTGSLVSLGQLCDDTSET